jgi:hypothetical protein
MSMIPMKGAIGQAWAEGLHIPSRRVCFSAGVRPTYSDNGRQYNEKNSRLDTVKNSGFARALGDDELMF